MSIAVLPFVNLSADKSQEFFSDGMTEELTSALAKIPGLAVIGRASAFQFKGQNRDLRAIGNALGVKNLIDGSVRKEGDEVRISAALIRASEGTQLWTENYDRQLKSIFAVQEDIATSIANALKVPLGLKQGENLVSNRTADTQSYQDYLRGIALFRARKIEDLVPLMKSVVARDPSYAPAWALLAQAYNAPRSFTKFEEVSLAGKLDEARSLAAAQDALTEQAAHQALKLDPRNASALDALASVEGHRGHWIEAEDLRNHAIASDPNDPDILYGYGYNLAATGNLKAAMQLQTRLMAQEPFVPVYQSRTADVAWALGRYDEALKIFDAMNPQSRDYVRQAKVYASMGRFTEAADALTRAKPGGGASRSDLDQAARLLRSAPAKVADPAALPLLPPNLSFVYLFVGADARSLEMVEREMDAGYDGGIFRDPWAPPSAALRKTDAFKTFVRKANLVTYWRARGWPEFCRPVGSSDFACH